MSSPKTVRCSDVRTAPGASTGQDLHPVLARSHVFASDEHTTGQLWSIREKAGSLFERLSLEHPKMWTAIRACRAVAI